MIKCVNASLAKLGKEPNGTYSDSEAFYNEGSCQILSQSANLFDVLISDDEEDIEVRIEESSDDLHYYLNGKKTQWDAYGIAALMQVRDALENLDSACAQLPRHIYTRKGMVKRVLNGRREKAGKRRS